MSVKAAEVRGIELNLEHVWGVFLGVKESENMKVNEFKLSEKDLCECWMTKGIHVTETERPM